MAVPWFRILDALIGASDIARRASRRQLARAAGAEEQLAAGGPFGRLEARLAGVVVAALKEAFDRDTRRLDLERQQIEAERQRAERALRLELMRQAADREVGRLRLVAGIAVVSWIGTLFFSTRLMGAGVVSKIMLGGGWVLLLAALALSFAAQTRVSERMARADDYQTPFAIDGGGAGTAAPWLVIAGLALVGFAVLFV